MKADITKNKARNIIESRILARARSDAGIYGQRLLVRLVEMTQKYIRGDNFDKVLNKERIEVNLWGDALFRFRVNSILSSENDNNYTVAKKAIEALMNSRLTFEDEDVYETTHILGSAKIFKNQGIMEIQVMHTVWQAMLDFTKGFVQYDPDVAIRLTSEYALILYKQLRNQQNPLTYSFEKLRKLFHIEDKYKKNADILDKVLKPAKEELDAISSISFAYEKVYSLKPTDRLQRGRKACIGVKITPIHVTRNDKTDAVIRCVSPAFLIGKELYDVLVNKFGFDYGGIKANLPLFDTAVKNMQEGGYLNWLRSIAPAALRCANPAGYVINATKKMLSEKYGINVRVDKPAVTGTIPKQQQRKSSEASNDEQQLREIFASIISEMKNNL